MSIKAAVHTTADQAAAAKPEVEQALRNANSKGVQLGNTYMYIYVYIYMMYKYIL